MKYAPKNAFERSVIDLARSADGVRLWDEDADVDQLEALGVVEALGALEKLLRLGYIELKLTGRGRARVDGKQEWNFTCSWHEGRTKRVSVLLDSTATFDETTPDRWKRIYESAEHELSKLGWVVYPASGVVPDERVGHSCYPYAVCSAACFELMKRDEERRAIEYRRSAVLRQTYCYRYDPQVRRCHLGPGHEGPCEYVAFEG